MRRVAEGIRLLLFAIIVLIVFSTGFYRFAEGWGTIDSLYFTIETATTVGYGDFVPTNDISKIFTAFLSIVGIAMMLTLFGIISSGYTSMMTDREKKRGEQIINEEQKLKEMKSRFKQIKKIVKKS